MNIDELKTLSQKDKKTLISLIEGMPSDINMSVKMHINDDFMNPSLSNTNIRNMHKYSTIYKYLDKVNIRDIPEPTMSFYQEEYCVCIDMITKSKKINRHTVSKLVATI